MIDPGPPSIVIPPIALLFELMAELMVPFLFEEEVGPPVIGPMLPPSKF
jgi:hypothetical protein